MAELFTGKVDIQTAGSQITVTLNGDNGDVAIGGNGQTGEVSVRNGTGTERVRIDAATGTVSTRSAAQVLTISLEGSTGDVILRGVNVPGQGSPRIRLLASEGNIWLGGNGKDGDLVLFKSDGDNSTLKQATVHLDAGQGNMWLGGKGTDGDLVLFPSSATDINDLSQASIHLDGQAGDIILKNADCAEDFDVAAGEALEPGTVVMVDEDGLLRLTQGAYDRRVVGVVSGAGDKRPGIVLDRQSFDATRQTVALMGKVYCRVDAGASPIRAGDLLAPAAAEGHAMKAERCPEAFGAVIGKALGSLATGRGMIPMLVSLQ